MASDNDRSSRESSIASGWTIEGSESASASSDGQGELTRSSPGAGGVNQVAAAPDGDVPAEAAEVLAGDRTQLSSGSLVLLGLIGGVYLLYTFVWFSWANYYSVVNSAVAEGSGSIGGVLQQVTFWIAPFAPALWFVSVLVLCRNAGMRRRALWLLLGAIVLVPLPMFEGLF